MGRSVLALEEYRAVSSSRSREAERCPSKAAASSSTRWPRGLPHGLATAHPLQPTQLSVNSPLCTAESDAAAAAGCHAPSGRLPCTQDTATSLDADTAVCRHHVKPPQ